MVYPSTPTRKKLTREPWGRFLRNPFFLENFRVVCKLLVEHWFELWGFLVKKYTRVVSTERVKRNNHVIEENGRNINIHQMSLQRKVHVFGFKKIVPISRYVSEVMNWHWLHRMRGNDRGLAYMNCSLHNWSVISKVFLACCSRWWCQNEVKSETVLSSWQSAKPSAIY